MKLVRERTSAALRVELIVHTVTNRRGKISTDPDSDLSKA
jgi:hypothetical protein